LCPAGSPAADRSAGFALYIGGPQHDSPIAGTSREAKAFVDQSGSDSGAARLRFDQQQTQLRGVGSVGSGAEDAADSFAVELGDPRGLASAVHTVTEVRDHAGDERLEGGIPAVLGCVSGTVPFHHPAQVAGFGGT
jgi:hypothetical protein